MEEVDKAMVERYELEAPKIVNYYISKNFQAVQFFESLDDMRQMMLLKIWQSLHNYDENKGTFSTYLMCCCRSVVGVQIRKTKQRKYAETVSMSEEICDGLCIEDLLCDEKDCSEDLYQEMRIKAIMPLLCKETYLYYLRGVKQIEIAEMFGVTQAQVSMKIKKNIHQIRQALRTEREL